MNKKQKIVVLITAFAIVLMLLFPPFNYKLGYTYGFLLTPPVNTYEELGRYDEAIQRTVWPKSYSVCSMDVHVLLLECFAALILALPFLSISVAPKKDNRKTKSTHE